MSSQTKIHLRRCHHCGHVCEADLGLVEECSQCQKKLAPYYFFDEALAVGLKTEEEARSEYKSSALPHKSYPPLWGITVYWDKDPEIPGPKTVK